MRITVDTTGLDRMLARLPDRREEYLDTFAAKVERRAVQTIRAKNIVDVGNFMDSIQSWTPQPGTRRIGDGVEYGIYHEFGTYKMGARPWLVPSFETEYATFVEGLKALFHE